MQASHIRCLVWVCRVVGCDLLSFQRLTLTRKKRRVVNCVSYVSVKWEARREVLSCIGLIDGHCCVKREVFVSCWRGEN